MYRPVTWRCSPCTSSRPRTVHHVQASDRTLFTMYRLATPKCLHVISSSDLILFATYRHLTPIYSPRTGSRPHFARLALAYLNALSSIQIRKPGLACPPVGRWPSKSFIFAEKPCFLALNQALVGHRVVSSMVAFNLPLFSVLTGN